MKSLLALLLVASAGLAQQPTGGSARTALASQAEIAWRKGDRADALRKAREITSAYENSSVRWTAEDRVAAGRAYVVLGNINAESVRSALKAFDAAVVAEPGNLDARIRTGNLFLDKFNAPEAKTSFEEVLKRDSANARALLGLARVLETQGKREWITLVRRAVVTNPALADAHIALARHFLEAEAYDSASTEARKAVASDSTSISAWALLGATGYLTGDSTLYRSAHEAAAKINPRPSEFVVAIAEAAIRQRRYGEGIRLASEAVALDSTSVSALGILGTNKLREGKVEESRVALERAFKLDPFNVSHKNTLDLIDQLQKFKTINRGHFQVVAPSSEADVLAMYLLPVLEQEWDTLTKRYGYTPPTPVRLEIYDRHADFSVRTMGLTGLGALGVSFGPVLAMDAPSSRDKGEFNWGSVAWHELAHTFTLGLSEFRTPRWLTEGLSVLEERRARPEWGAKESVEFIGAYKAGRIRPPSQLNEGFVAPRYEAETIFSYYDASLVCEMMEEMYGPQAIVDMLKGYRDGLRAPAVLTKVLHEQPATFDAKFDTWIRVKFAAAFQSIDANDGQSAPSGPFITAMREGMAALGDQQTGAARAAFARAETLFPGYAGTGAPAFMLAKLAIDEGHAKEALAHIAMITSRNESSLNANEMEAHLRLQVGDTAGALVPLQRLLWISPYDVNVHQQIAEIASRSGNHAMALRERRAIVALKPTDMLAARFELARELAVSGDSAAARKELLEVLEQAPSFEKAQTLLLELRKTTSP